jgi:hypothetical protein
VGFASVDGHSWSALDASQADWPSTTSLAQVICEDKRENRSVSLSAHPPPPAKVKTHVITSDALLRRHLAARTVAGIGFEPLAILFVLASLGRKLLEIFLAVLCLEPQAGRVSQTEVVIPQNLGRNR